MPSTCSNCHDCSSCKGQYCLSDVPIFSTLQNQPMKEISELILRRKYKKGQMLFFEGDVSDKLFIIHQGKVKIYKHTKEGKEQILYILSEGDFIGDLNLLKKGQFQFNAEALEEVGVCMLTKDHFDGLIRKYPDITFKILEELYERLLKLESLIQRLSTKDVEARLADMILDFSKNFGTTVEKGILIQLPLSREEMANYIGITRETISRKLTSLQEDGFIELIGNKQLLIRNIEALEDLC